MIRGISTTTTASPTSSTVVTSSATATGGAVDSQPVVVGAGSLGPAHRDVAAAIFAYLQAHKAMGRAEIKISEISIGLGIPMETVEKAVKRLSDKGVRIDR